MPRPAPRWLLVLALLAAAVPRGRALGEEEAEEETCAPCHGEKAFADGEGRSLYVSDEAFGRSAHGSLGCTVCHDDAAEIPHAEDLAAVGLQACTTCHEDVVAEYQAGAHALAGGGSAAAPTCAGCHGDIHSVRPHSEADSSAHWSKLAATCARCHADPDLAGRFDIPIARPVEAYLESVHARAVAAGKHGAVCSDCHGAHRILPGSNPESPIWRDRVPETCGTCHREVLNAFQQSVHGVALARGVREAPVCTDCHGEHRILGRGEAESPVFAANIPVETCGRCHADERLAAKYGLSIDKFSAFQDSFHGLALRSGRVSVANCASCHGVHDILPSTHPNSRVHPSRLPETCGNCHPGAGERFAIGSVHVSALSPGRLEYWIRLIYLVAIVAVIGFMAVHNGLDLTWKARRPTILAAGALDAEVAERMSRPLRWQHGLVMVSFPVLVYTGFALTYPESWWAAPLLGWESRLGLRGAIHRAAALVLIGSLLWHALHYATSPRLRRCLGGLRPSLDDLRHLGAMLSYYAGRRPVRPHGGEFSYVEKAEYWAFVWGIVIMTATGVLLWFSDAALRYLPKWATDAATAIHFYEAVLATLAIVVWHLYWVIFDPDVYPMDWSWWNGKPPVARVLERGGSAAPKEDGAGSAASPGDSAAIEEEGGPS